jgi:hypothetical protein
LFATPIRRVMAGRLGIFIKDICFYIFRAHDED